MTIKFINRLSEIIPSDAERVRLADFAAALGSTVYVTGATKQDLTGAYSSESQLTLPTTRAELFAAAEKFGYPVQENNSGSYVIDTAVMTLGNDNQQSTKSTENNSSGKVDYFCTPPTISLKRCDPLTSVCSPPSNSL